MCTVNHNSTMRSAQFPRTAAQAVDYSTSLRRSAQEDGGCDRMYVTEQTADSNFGQESDSRVSHHYCAVMAISITDIGAPV